MQSNFDLRAASLLTSRLFLGLFNTEFVRYFLVSLAALAVDLTLFSLGIRVLGMSWAASATISFSLGLLVAYGLSIRFVFASRKFSKTPIMELLSFSAVGLGGLLVTQIILWISIEWFKINPEISKFVAAGFTFLFNFTVRKLLLFSATKKPSNCSRQTE